MFPSGADGGGVSGTAGGLAFSAARASCRRCFSSCFFRRANSLLRLALRYAPGLIPIQADPPLPTTCLLLHDV